MAAVVYYEFWHHKPLAGWSHKGFLERSVVEAAGTVADVRPAPLPEGVALVAEPPQDGWLFAREKIGPWETKEPKFAYWRRRMRTVDPSGGSGDGSGSTAVSPRSPGAATQAGVARSPAARTPAAAVKTPPRALAQTGSVLSGDTESSDAAAAAAAAAATGAESGGGDSSVGGGSGFGSTGGSFPEVSHLRGTVTVFENERWRPVGGWGASYLLMADPPAWTDVYATGPVAKDRLTAPIEDAGWQGGWEQGEWEYGKAFRLGTFTTGVAGTIDCCRRRAHVRQYTVRKDSDVLARVPENHFKYLSYMLTQGYYAKRRLAEGKDGGGGGGNGAGAPLSSPVPGESPAATLLNHSFAGETAVVPNHCMVCEKPYTRPLRLEHHCRVCFLSVCGDCSPLTVSVQGYSKEMRTCKVCCKARGLSPSDRAVNPVRRALQDVAAFRKAAHMKNRDGADELVACIPADVAAGTLRVTLHECHALQRTELGVVNPQVELFISGSYVRSNAKTQTKSPVWGDSYSMPYADPSASLFISVHDVDPHGMSANYPLGRAAVPLDYVRRRAKTAAKPVVDLWVELLPPGPAERAGYAAAEPQRFRGVSPVCATLGMHAPKRPLGHVRVSLRDELAPNHSAGRDGGALGAFLRSVPNGVAAVSYITAPVVKVEGGVSVAARSREGGAAADGEEAKDENEQNAENMQEGVYLLKDEVVRAKSFFAAPPYLILLLWSNPSSAFALLPLWYGVAFALQFHQVPVVLAVLIILNGVLYGRSANASQAYETFVLYEEANTYKGKSIFEKLQAFQMVLKMLSELHRPLRFVSSSLHKFTCAFMFHDSWVSWLASGILLIGSILLSAVLFLVSFVPIRVHIFIVGAVLMLLPAVAAASKKAVPEGNDAAAAAPADEKTPSPLQVYGRNFYHRIPDSQELVHRAICSSRVSETDPRVSDNQR
eukprot:Rhum_TRINITY_DN15338_c0_g1::Rhum_TRINITY_DN15338_c0_g1_i2::g.149771::m.149771